MLIVLWCDWYRLNARSLYLGNMPDSMNEEDVFSVFTPYNVDTVRIIRDGDTGASPPILPSVAVLTQGFLQSPLQTSAWLAVLAARHSNLMWEPSFAAFASQILPEVQRFSM